MMMMVIIIVIYKLIMSRKAIQEEEDKIEMIVSEEEALSPDLIKELDSLYRKERALNNKVLNDKQCLTCKIIGGVLFFGAGTIHAFRVLDLWPCYPRREKIFNILAVGFLYLISGANFNAAYQTYLG